MSLADSMLAYGKKKIKLSQAGKMGERISSIGDVFTEAGQAVSSIGKAVKPNIETYKQVQAGRETIGAEADKGTLWQRLGLKSSLDDKISVGEDNYQYTTEGLKEIGILSDTSLAKEGGYLEKLSEDVYKDKDWWKKFGTESLTSKVTSEIKDPVVPDAPELNEPTLKKIGDNVSSPPNEFIYFDDKGNEVSEDKAQWVSQGQKDPESDKGLNDIKANKAINDVINLDKKDDSILQEDKLTKEQKKIEEIKKEQQMLVDLGYDIGKTGVGGKGVDGVKGVKTKDALANFEGIRIDNTPNQENYKEGSGKKSGDYIAYDREGRNLGIAFQMKDGKFTPNKKFMNIIGVDRFNELIPGQIYE